MGKGGRGGLEKGGRVVCRGGVSVARGEVFRCSIRHLMDGLSTRSWVALSPRLKGGDWVLGIKAGGK